jgi:hypothetical protein
MPSYRHFTQIHRDYIREHYRTRGANRCANATGLTITQVWGLAARMGIAKRRGTRQPATRSAENGHRGIRNPGYRISELEAAIRNWTASAEPCHDSAPS